MNILIEKTESENNPELIILGARTIVINNIDFIVGQIDIVQFSKIEKNLNTNKFVIDEGTGLPAIIFE